MAKKREAMARLNTRITVEQDTFVKSKAKTEKKSEGEVFREMLQFFINAITNKK